MKSATLFIVNPNSGGGKSKHLWPEIEKMIPQYFSSYSVEFTKKSGDAEQIASQAHERGVKTLISVGGDGTLNEIVNGLMQIPQAQRNKIKVGVFSLGSGNDFAKSLNIPTHAEERLKLMSEGLSKKVDVTEISFFNHQKKPCTRYMINVADFGLGAEVVKKVNHSGKSLGGRLTYLKSVLSSLWPIKKFSGVLSCNDQNYHFNHLLLVFVANGRFCGSGLQVAPHALLDDKKLEIIVVEEMSLIHLLILMSKIYRRKDFSHPAVYKFSASSMSFKVTSEDDVFIEVDGEQPGMIPGSFKILNEEIHFLIPSA